MSWIQRLVHHRSTIDDLAIPNLLVSRNDASTPAGGEPASQSATTQSVLVILPDANGASADDFRSWAFEQAHHWTQAIGNLSPAPIFVLPYTRGMKCQGWAEHDLLQMVDEIASSSDMPMSLVLLASGRQAKAVLELASWHPHRWAGVVLIDPNLEGMTTTILQNAQRVPVYVDRPWWRVGFAGSSGKQQVDAAVAQLSRAGFTLTLAFEPAGLRRQHAVGVSNPKHLFEWVAHLEPAKATDDLVSWKWSCSTMRRAQHGPLAIEAIEPAGSCATISVVQKPGQIELLTDHVRTFRWSVADQPMPSFKIDRQRIKVARLAESSNAQPPFEVFFERTGEGWFGHQLPINRSTDPHHASAEYYDGASSADLMDPSHQNMLKTPERGGPICDLLFKPILIVTGSLGDESTNLAMQQAGEAIRTQLQGQAASQYVPIVIKLDRDVSERELESYSLILIGRPHENLLVERLRAQLPIHFAVSDSDSEGGDLDAEDAELPLLSRHELAKDAEQRDDDHQHVHGTTSQDEFESIPSVTHGFARRGAGGVLLLPNPYTLDQYLLHVWTDDPQYYCELLACDWFGSFDGLLHPGFQPPAMIESEQLDQQTSNSPEIYTWTWNLDWQADEVTRARLSQPLDQHETTGRSRRVNRKSKSQIAVPKSTTKSRTRTKSAKSTRGRKPRKQA